MFVSLSVNDNFFFSVAKRFEAEYGVMRLSIGEAVRRVLMEQPKTELADTINNHLKKGLTVPDDLAVACLEVALMDMTAQTRGYENTILWSAGPTPGYVKRLDILDSLRLLLPIDCII